MQGYRIGCHSVIAHQIICTGIPRRNRQQAASVLCEGNYSFVYKSCTATARRRGFLEGTPFINQDRCSLRFITSLLATTAMVGSPQ